MRSFRLPSGFSCGSDSQIAPPAGASRHLRSRPCTPRRRGTLAERRSRPSALAPLQFRELANADDGTAQPGRRLAFGFGLGLAIELGQSGLSVAVVERFRLPQPIPKGQNLTQRTSEHFHFWGCELNLRAARTVLCVVSSGGLVCYKTLLGGYHYDWMQRSQVRPFHFL